MMKEMVFPLIVTTLPGLDNALKSDCRVIYAEQRFYEQCQEQITQAMRRHCFIARMEQGRRGVFFLRCQGEWCFDPQRHHICDPYDTL